jgi:hypothetical protein
MNKTIFISLILVSAFNVQLFGQITRQDVNKAYDSFNKTTDNVLNNIDFLESDTTKLSYFKLKDESMKIGYFTSWNAPSTIAFMNGKITSFIFKDPKTNYKEEIPFNNIYEIYFVPRNGVCDNLVNPYKLINDNNTCFVYLKSYDKSGKLNESAILLVLKKELNSNSSFNNVKSSSNINKKVKILESFSQNTSIISGLPTLYYIEKNGKLYTGKTAKFYEIVPEIYLDCPKILNLKKWEKNSISYTAKLYENDDCLVE